MSVRDSWRTGALAAAYRTAPRRIPSGIFGVLNELADHALEVARARGYYRRGPDEELPAAVANLHEEVGELWRAWRKGELGAPSDKAALFEQHELEVLTQAEEELADALIKVLELAALLGVDIEKSVHWKDWLNQLRPGPGQEGGRRA